MAVVTCLWFCLVACGQTATGDDAGDEDESIGEGREGDAAEDAVDMEAGEDGDAGSDDAEDFDGPQECSASEPEQCNGIDDNCNGTTDEGLLQLIDAEPLELDVGQDDYEYLVYGQSTTPIPDGWATLWSRTPRLDGSGRPMTVEDPTGYLTIVDATGARTAGPVAVFSGTVRPPAPMAVEWTGSDIAFLIAPWNYAGLPSEVMFGSASRDGHVVLAPSPLLVFEDGVGSGPLVEDSVGSAWVYVFWRADAPDEQLMFARVSDSGTLVGAPVEVLSDLPTSTDGRAPLPVWTGTEYGIAWRGKFMRADASGRLLGEPVALTGRLFGSADRCALSWNGGEWATAWSGCCGLAETCDGPSDGNGVLFRRFDREGIMVGEDLCLTPTTSYRWEARVAARGSEFAVGWTDGGIPGAPGPSCDTGYVVRLTARGDRIGEPIRLGECEGGPAEVFPTAQGYAVLMSYHRIMRIECPR